jgi:hypothetical protein
MLETPTQNSAARVAIGLTRQIKPKASSKIVDVSQDPRGRFLSIRMDGREAAMKYLDEAVAGLIAVNGIVHLRCIEPFISVALDVGNGEPKIRGLGIETTTQALWGPGTTTFAFFGLSKWDEAIQFAEGLGWTGTVTSEPIAELRVLLQESLTYDWGISYKAAVEARAMQKALTMFSRVFEPRLEKVIHSQDADEQYEVMLSLDHDDPRWQDNATAQRSYEKAIAILENRTINMSLQKTLGMRP